MQSKFWFLVSEKVKSMKSILFSRTFVYTLMFFIASFESLVLLLLLLPLGENFRKKIFSLIQYVQTKFTFWLGILFSLILILFIDAVNTANKSRHPDSSQQNIIFDPYSHCKLFYAQRNAYLTFITLVMGFILYSIPFLFKSIQ